MSDVFLESSQEIPLPFNPLCGGVENIRYNILNTQNQGKKTFFFAFQMGHIEIGKVTKLGYLEAILRVLELIFGKK